MDGTGTRQNALAGIRVVDLTSGPAGGTATMVLADHGADVIKVEPPRGDRFRSMASAPLWLRGKRSVVLDLHDSVARRHLRSLTASADVVVLSGSAERAREWGISFEEAATLRPDVVYCSITGWGSCGPFAHMPAYDGVVAALGGRMLAFERQLRQGRPVFSALPVTMHAAAQGAVQGIVAALIARERGETAAQLVETSLLQGLLPYDLSELLLVEVAARQGRSLPNIFGAGGVLPTLNYHPIRTSDGRWIQCGNLLEHLLLACFDAMGLLDQLFVDERFASPPSDWSPEAIEIARELMLTKALTKSAEEWMDIFRANGNVAAEIFDTTANALHHPDIVANGDIVVLDDPVCGPVRTIGPLAEFSATPPVIGRPAPLIGEHTEAVLASLTSSTTTAAAVAATATAGGPLAGVTVVEFASIIAAPLATALLADLGARVIRVEPLEGDPYRHMVPGGAPAAKTTAGKESICIDLKRPDGRATARRLAARADVVVHNFRPAVAERLGLGEADLRSVSPGLVWVSVSGYGRHSPSASRPSTHPCAGAMTGGASLQAGPAITAPCDSYDELVEVSRQLVRANESNPDPNTSVVAASAILLALLHRQRTGAGQAIYVNMLAANLYANIDDALEYDGKAPRLLPDAELLGLSATYRLYQTADGWVFLAVTTDDEWRRLCSAIGHDDLAADPRFADLDGRTTHDRELSDVLCELLRARGADEWQTIGLSARVALVRADGATPGTFFSTHPQVRENDFTPECVHARFGLHRRWGPIVTVNGALPTYRPGVLAGEHTDQILGELDLDAGTLRAEKVVTSEEP